MSTQKYNDAPFAQSLNLSALGRAIAITALLLSTLATPVYAARPKSQKPGATIIVYRDPGGSVRDRYNEIQKINALGQKVEIRNGACMSSCTMLLGVHDVCVTPDAIFGFHGPYRFGSTLTPEEFDQWSRVISSHYPIAVQNWYMQKARYKTYTASRLSGAELIRLGVNQCP